MYARFSIVFFLCLSFFLPAHGQLPPNKIRPLYFSRQQINSKNFVQVKHDEWSACHRKQTPALFEAYPDILRAFVGDVSINNLSEMEAKHLMEGKTEHAPWSGDYWSYSRGILGSRYRDPNFSRLFDWQTRYQYIQANPAEAILKNYGQNGALMLSASEKYDLIADDSGMALTQSMWAQGKYYFDQTGEVEGWMGICHGWAPAAIMEPRPEHKITVPSYDQKWMVELRPSEIKGLASYSWANNDYGIAALGHRCNKKDPKRDADGRLTDPECFDLNPATWHLAVVNRLGRQGRSFVMDATYDYEVWNQPVLSYSYTYFNVETDALETDLNKATTELSVNSKDKYAKYRSPAAKYVVGIAMSLTYVSETLANDSEKDVPEFDAHVSVTYRYDLELNAEGIVIGGEWHQNVHPDFIWAPRNGAQPLAPLDTQLSPADWSGEGRIPASWADSARLSSNQGQILNTITRALILRASEKRE